MYFYNKPNFIFLATVCVASPIVAQVILLQCATFCLLQKHDITGGNCRMYCLHDHHLIGIPLNNYFASKLYFTGCDRASYKKNIIKHAAQARACIGKRNREWHAIHSNSTPTQVFFPFSYIQVWWWERVRWRTIEVCGVLVKERQEESIRVCSILNATWRQNCNPIWCFTEC